METTPHRPERWRVVVFLTFAVPWAMFFLLITTLRDLGRVGLRLHRVHDRMLDWLHTGCPACPQRGRK